MTREAMFQPLVHRCSTSRQGCTRLFDSLPLTYPYRGADIRVVAFITEAAPVEYAT